jgi:NAD+ synthase
MKIPKELELPYDKVELKIEEGIKRYMKKNKIERAVIGISGGLDSSVTAYLTSKAIGSDRVVGVTMNDIATPIQDRSDAEKIIQELKIKHLDVDISSTSVALADLLKQELFKKFSLKDLEKVNERGKAYINIKSRLRMTILYFFGNRLNGAVIGTSDRSEIMLGYFTKYGDGAADILPLGNLYKSQVRALGQYLDLPESILRKKSSPGLIKNLTAEEELGFDYDTADLILFYKFEKNYPKEEITKNLNLEEELVETVLSRVKANAHKRKMPPIVSINKV